MTTPPGPSGPASSSVPPTPSGEPKKSRAGRNLPAAIGSAVVLLAAIALCLVTFDGFPFVFLVTAAIGVGCWELWRALRDRGVHLPLEPLLAGVVVMLFGAWYGGAPPLATGPMMLWESPRRVARTFCSGVSAPIARPREWKAAQERLLPSAMTSTWAIVPAPWPWLR